MIFAASPANMGRSEKPMSSSAVAEIPLATVHAANRIACLTGALNELPDRTNTNTGNALHHLDGSNRARSTPTAT